jgi:hypothetical protein
MDGNYNNDEKNAYQNNGMAMENDMMANNQQQQQQQHQQMGMMMDDYSRDPNAQNPPNLNIQFDSGNMNNGMGMNMGMGMGMAAAGGGLGMMGGAPAVGSPGGTNGEPIQVAETMEVVFNYVPNLSDEIYLCKFYFNVFFF